MTATKEQTLLTDDQLDAFEALEDIFGETEILHSDVNRHTDYGQYATNYLKHALNAFAALKVINETDWDEIDRLANEERRKALAERAEGIRDTVVTGALTAAVVKARKQLPDSIVTFDVDAEGAALEITEASGKSPAVVVEYDPVEKILVTNIEGRSFEDEVDVVDGSQSPRAQFSGIDALYKWLEGDFIHD